MQLNSDPSAYSPSRLDRSATLRRLGPLNLMALLALLVSAVLFAYLRSGQRLILLVAVLLTAVGVDGILRSNLPAKLRDLGDRATYVSVPVLFTLGAGVFFRYTVSGFWTFPTALLSGVALGGIVYAEYRTGDATGEQLLTLRLVLNMASYLAAFALYTALYNQRLPLSIAALLVGAVSFTIGLDILRTVDLTHRALILYSATLAFMMIEARWALNFISLAGWLGGVFVLVLFYVGSQALQSYLTRHLDRRSVLEYSTVAIAGTILVILGRVLTRG